MQANASRIHQPLRDRPQVRQESTGNRLLRFAAVNEILAPEIFKDEMGVQGGMSANQTCVLPIRPKTGSRMNTVFLVLIFVLIFVCGAADGAIGSPLFHAGGWSTVCISGICLSVAFVAWLFLDYAIRGKKSGAQLTMPGVISFRHLERQFLPWNRAFLRSPGEGVNVHPSPLV